MNYVNKNQNESFQSKDAKGNVFTGPVRMAAQIKDIDKKDTTACDILAAYVDIKKTLQSEIDELIDKRDNKLLEQVVVMREGKGFGELALKKERLMPRAATIKCLVACHCASMSKSNYNKVLAKLEQRKLKKLIDFYKSIPFLAKNSKTYLQKLHYNFEQRIFIRNQIIYSEGDSSDHVFIVQSGEFEVTKKIKFVGTE